MKISTNTRYALRFLACLAACGCGRLTTAAIASREGISEKMLERIAAKLKREGIVRACRGIGGGYELARPAEEITVAEILHMMETPYLPLHCSGGEEGCEIGGLDCRFYRLFGQIDSAISSVTEHVSIADLVRDLPCEELWSPPPAD